MIGPIKKKLTFIFTVTIFIFNLLVMMTISLYFHEDMQALIEVRLQHEMVEDLLNPYLEGRPEMITNEVEGDLFELVKPDGTVALASINPLSFIPPIDEAMLAGAFKGDIGYLRQDIGGSSFLSLYFPIDDEFVGRGVAPLDILVDFEHTVVLIAVVGLPLIVLISLLLSYYLVSKAMVPISKVFIFQDTFSSNVTHELMSPLTSLKGNLEVTLRKKRETADYVAAFQLGLREVDRIISLLNNLYLLASSKFKLLDLFKEKTDLAELVEELLDGQKERLAEKKIHLEYTPGESASCICDVSLIRRTIENLLDNALKYSPGGGSISIQVGRNNRLAFLEMTNSVANIGGGNREKWFEPFVRGDQGIEEDIVGKGLGLYISRYIAQSHGGELHITAVTEENFTIKLSLPTKPKRGIPPAIRT